MSVGYFHCRLAEDRRKPPIRIALLLVTHVGYVRERLRSKFFSFRYVAGCGIPLLCHDANWGQAARGSKHATKKVMFPPKHHLPTAISFLSNSNASACQAAFPLHGNFISARRSSTTDFFVVIALLFRPGMWRNKLSGNRRDRKTCERSSRVKCSAPPSV